MCEERLRHPQMPRRQDPEERVQPGTMVARTAQPMPDNGTLNSQAEGRAILLGPRQLLHSVSVCRRGKDKMQNSIYSQKGH